MLGITTRSRQAMLALGAALAAGLALLPATAGAAPGMQRVDAHTGARAYWTPARMRAAEPVDPVDASSLGEGAPAAPAAAAGGGGTPTYVGPAAAGVPDAATLRSGSIAEPRRYHPGSDFTRDEIDDPSAPAYSAHGKVYFKVVRGTEPGNYVCSGTAVNSRNRSVVWTAGHCIYDHEASGGYSRKFIFVPGYEDGNEPYGEWPAKAIATTPGWRYHANLSYDLGAAIVSRDASMRALQRVVGATGIGFSQPRLQPLEAFGYPAVPGVGLHGIPLHPEFDGEHEFRCTTKPFGADPSTGDPGPQTTGIGCDMTAGASGGGWISRTTGLLTSVTSYGYENEIDHLYGPYMTKQAKALYKLVRGKRRR
jgi:V8-like Glu-specific endopeptidase